MSANDDKEYIAAVVQHLFELRDEITNNQRALVRGNNDLGDLEQLKVANESNRKVVAGIQILLDEREKHSFTNTVRFALTAAIIVAVIVWPLLLNLLAGR